MTKSFALSAAAALCLTTSIASAAEPPSQ
ncbi:hypothetical protein, partial [Cronobacter sakazakii]